MPEGSDPLTNVQPAIKPGDTVRVRETGETWPVAIVHQSIALSSHGAEGEPDFGHCEIVDGLDLVIACSPEEERAMVMRWATFTDDGWERHEQRREYARAEALRRGWRVLDIGDVSTVETAVDVYVNGQSELIGAVKESGQAFNEWLWQLTGWSEWITVKGLATGIAAVIDAENQRREQLARTS